MRIAKWYRLHKDGEFYFLYRDRYSFIPNDHATKLSSALCRLSKSPSQGSGNAKTELADEKVSLISPLNKSQEAASRTKAQEIKRLSLTSGNVMVQHEGKEVQLPDSIAVDVAASLPHDIQIHVQRPSPVREVPASQRKLFSVGTAPDLKDGEQEVLHEPAESATERNAELIAEQSSLAEDLSTELANRDELALSSVENVSSDVVRKVQEVDLQQRVRPTSGPATVTCADQPKFSLVRKSQSVTNNLDEEVEDADFVVHSRRSVGAICSVTHDVAGRPFAGSTGFSPAKDSMRRIHSTVSFDRPSLKSPDSSVDIDEAVNLTRNSSGQSSSQKANFYGLRSRHTSGLETPMSALDTSSVTSMGEGTTQNIVTLK